jgi:hypothetical protein
MRDAQHYPSYIETELLLPIKKHLSKMKNRVKYNKLVF